MENRKNIIFDWSGVIKDAFESHFFVVNKIFRKYGLNLLSLNEFRGSWEEPYMKFFNKYLPSLSLEDEQKAYKEGVSDKDYPKSKAFPGITKLITELKEKGNFVAVISSDFPETLLNEMKEYGLENTFDDVITNIHDKEDTLRELIEKYRLGKNNTFIIGDSQNEIAAGKKLGIKTVAVTWGLASENKLKNANPDKIVHNLKELKKVITGND